MKSQLITFRSLFLIGGLFTLILLGSAYCLEYFFNLEPCPLCYLQRYMLWVIAVLFCAGAIQNCKNKGQLIYSGGVILFSLLGAMLALRHLWLQYFFTPSGVEAECTAGFEKLLQFKPLLEVLHNVLTSTESCTRVDFTLMRLSLSAWSLLGFMGIISFAIIIYWLKIKRRI